MFQPRCSPINLDITALACNSRVNIRLVDSLCLIVPLFLLSHLLLEPQTLFKGVVQLGVSVAELLSAHEALEPFAQARTRTMPLGERGHDLRMADDERRGDAEGFDELSDKLESQSER